MRWDEMDYRVIGYETKGYERKGYKMKECKAKGYRWDKRIRATE